MKPIENDTDGQNDANDLIKPSIRQSPSYTANMLSITAIGMMFVYSVYVGLGETFGLHGVVIGVGIFIPQIMFGLVSGLFIGLALQAFRKGGFCMSFLPTTAIISGVAFGLMILGSLTQATQ